MLKEKMNNSVSESDKKKEIARKRAQGWKVWREKVEDEESEETQDVAPAPHSLKDEKETENSEIVTQEKVLQPGTAQVTSFYLNTERVVSKIQSYAIV